VSWTLFEHAASRYEAWYATPLGRRADEAERSLLTRLLGGFPKAHNVLEVGCGSGHFTAWLAGQGWRVVGVDRAPAMLAEVRRYHPDMPVLLGDAHGLPMREGAVDLVVFITTLEFLDEATMALAEAARVARQGLVVVALNRWSLGGLSRRWGAQAGQPLLSQARDASVVSLRAMVKAAVGTRLKTIQWVSTLFPNGLWRVQAPIPLGEVIGMAARMTEKEDAR
jgi:ubiquinone/menaquinone biosynthesis C-methylase UbiE